MQHSRYKNGFYLQLESGIKSFHGLRLEGSSGSDADQSEIYYQPHSISIFYRLLHHPNSLKPLLGPIFREVTRFLISIFPGSEGVVHYIELSLRLMDPTFLQMWFLCLYQYFAPFRGCFSGLQDEAVEFLTSPFLQYRFLLLLNNPVTWWNRPLEKIKSWIQLTLEPLAHGLHNMMIIQNHPKLFDIFFQRLMTDFGQHEGIPGASWPTWEEWGQFRFPDGLSIGEKVKALEQDPMYLGIIAERDSLVVAETCDGSGSRKNEEGADPEDDEAEEDSFWDEPSGGEDEEASPGSDSLDREIEMCVQKYMETERGGESDLEASDEEQMHLYTENELMPSDQELSDYSSSDENSVMD